MNGIIYALNKLAEFAQILEARVAELEQQNASLRQQIQDSVEPVAES